MLTRRSAIVVALHKSGTNLLTRLVRAMRLEPIGAGVRESYPAIVKMLEERRHLMSSRSSRATAQTILTESSALLELWRLDPSPGTCIFLHGAGEPRDHPGSVRQAGLPVIFNYRDPRAVLVSFVHYLTGNARERFTEIDGFRALARVLLKLPSTAERVRFVITYAPNYLDRSFRGNAWLLKESGVLSVSYEALVGAAGGGSDELQRTTVERVMRHVAVDGDPHRISRALYDTQARTFRVGRIDRWRDEFTPDLLEQFDRAYGDVLTTYGYA